MEGLFKFILDQKKKMNEESFDLFLNMVNEDINFGHEVGKVYTESNLLAVANQTALIVNRL